MKYVSLFAGIGGFDLALNRLGHECVYANEWDKYSAQTYEKNFTHRPDTRDITTVEASEIPDHDLLVGGFPCQSFSVAGKRKGFADTRGTLFFDIARILAAKRPAYLLLENVKGLLSHDNNKTFQTILRTLDELGYDLQWQVLNSKNFGVPQNRERVFIIGHLRGTSRPKVFPIRENDGVSNEKQQEQIQRQIQANGQGGVQFYDNSKILENGKNRSLYQRFPLKFLNRNQRNIEGDYSFTVDGANTGGIMITQKSHDWRKDKSLREFKEYSPTLRAEMGDNFPMVNSIRRLTPIECERLQGFPDNWTEGVSDTQRYKQLGNAVTVNVVQEIIARLSHPIHPEGKEK